MTEGTGNDNANQDQLGEHALDEAVTPSGWVVTKEAPQPANEPVRPKARASAKVKRAKTRKPASKAKRRQAATRATGSKKTSAKKTGGKKTGSKKKPARTGKKKAARTSGKKKGRR